MAQSPTTPVIAGNWKMHKGPESARKFCREFAQVAPPVDDRTVLIFPPALSLTTVRDALAEHGIGVGVQDIHWEKEGAFTGQISGPMAREAGARYALVGHSERRHVFGETDEETARKVAAAIAASLVPVLCVGETLEERKAGRLEEVILRQLDAGIGGIPDDATARALIAYEPVWAIGTGKTATPEQAQEVHALIRAKIRGEDDKIADEIRLIYGGSVKASNAADIFAQPDIDGGLIGGAALKADDFLAIVNAG